MTKRSFIDTIRQYSTLAHRLHTSYALPVAAYYAHFVKGLRDDGYTGPELAKEMEWAAAFIEREYAPNDPEYQAPSDG